MTHSSVEQRLRARLALDETGCWLWQGMVGADGYGRIHVAGRPQLTHRVAYEVLVGAIPPDHEIDHLCRVRRCCNPAHLEAVTPALNRQRQAPFVDWTDRDTSKTPRGAAHYNRQKTHCPKGHPLSGPNLYLNGGRRHCRTCNRESSRNHMRDVRAMQRQATQRKETTDG